MESNIEEIQLKAYKCNECGKVFINKQMAELCHKKYYCEKCGKQTEKYSLLCDSCRDKQRYELATKMTYEKYKEKYPDYYIYYKDEYYADLDDLKEVIDELPEYVYGCDKDRAEIDIENEICNTEDNINIEDFQFDNTKKLIDFVKDWNKENGIDYYYADFNKIILLNKGK